MTTRIHFQTILALASVGTALCAWHDAGAQRPVRLVHGLGDVASRWYSAQARLQAEFGGAISASSPQLSNLAAISVQAGELATVVPAEGTLAIGIGHSAGGVVSRELDRGAVRDLFGVVTVGTPHTGAPIAANEGLAISLFGQFLQDVMYPVNLYWGNYGDHEAMAAAVDAVVITAAVIVYWNTLRPQITSAAASDLRPSSALMSPVDGLNSSSNLSREAASMGARRISLIGTMPAGQQLCAAMSPSFVDTCSWTFDAVGDGFYALWQYYSNYVDYSDPWMYAKRQNAFYWLPAATALWYGVNDDWCQIIGAVGCYGDGLIPVDRQFWPGATNVFVSGFTPHELEPERVIVQNQIVDNLRAVFGL